MKRTPTFDDFWRVYPLKKGKEDAEKKAWNRLTADEKRKAIAAVPLYIDDCRRNGIDRYKYPQGWLNGKRWRDYEELPEEKKEWMKPVADAWENDEEKEEEEDIAAKLGSVFKVTKLK